MTLRLPLLFALLPLVASSLQAQTTFSPHSRFGFGDLQTGRAQPNPAWDKWGQLGWTATT